MQAIEIFERSDSKETTPVENVFGFKPSSMGVGYIKLLEKAFFRDEPFLARVEYREAESFGYERVNRGTIFGYPLPKEYLVAFVRDPGTSVKRVIQSDELPVQNTPKFLSATTLERETRNKRDLPTLMKMDYDDSTYVSLSGHRGQAFYRDGILGTMRIDELKRNNTYKTWINECKSLTFIEASLSKLFVLHNSTWDRIVLEDEEAVEEFPYDQTNPQQGVVEVSREFNNRYLCINLARLMPKYLGGFVELERTKISAPLIIDIAALPLSMNVYQAADWFATLDAPQVERFRTALSSARVMWEDR